MFFQMTPRVVLPTLTIACLLAPAAEAQVLLSTLDAAAPVQSEFHIAQTTGQVNGPRLFRDAIPSRCGAAKAPPGPLSTGTFRYDAYSFVAQETTCQSIRFRRTGTTGIIHVQVHSTFDPADVTANYLADSGSSVVLQEGRALSFDVTAGQTYTVVVFNVTSMDEGAAYELTLDEPLTTTTVSALDATLPFGAGPYYNEGTGTLANIPALAAPASSCGVAKTTPATTGAGPYRFDRLQVMAPISECLTVTVRRIGPASTLAVAAYTPEFVNFDTGWLADSGGTTSSGTAAVSLSMQVTAGQVIDLVVFNATASEEGAEYEIVTSTPVQPPRRFRTTDVSGSDVTFRWVPPLHGPVPADYAIEGGVLPATPLVSVPFGSPLPITTLTGVPSGAFYVRARSVSGAASSAASNETRIFVNQAQAPSAPIDLLATVSGSDLGLTWRNTFTGGEATALALDVTGSATGSVPLSPRLESVAFAGAPGGSYTLTVRAENATGSSAASNPVSITLPGACAGVPQPPADFLAFRVGNRITILWEAPQTGPAPTSYTLNVSGAFVGSLATGALTLAGNVGPGAYTFTVQASHACGTSVPTVAQTVTVP